MAESSLYDRLGGAFAIAAVVGAGCDAQVRRIDGATREVSSFPGAGRQLAAGPDGGVWMLDPTRRSAVLVDGRTGAHRVEVDMRAFVAGAVAGFGRIWIVGEGDARLTALDPATGEILAVVDLGHEPSFGLAGADALYAVSANAHVIDVVDPETGAVVRSIEQLPLLATSVALAPDGLWIAGAGEARLIDPASGSVLRTIPASGTAWVAGDADAGWMVTSGAPELTLLWP